MTAPDLSCEVVGFRQWYVTEDLSLRSGVSGHGVWRPGENEARCVPNSKRLAIAFSTSSGTDLGEIEPPKPCPTAPGHDCECGFYALHSPTDFWYGPEAKRGGYVLMFDGSDPCLSGVVSAWGHIEVHAEGFRSQHARIVALARPKSKRDTVVARAVATVYGVPLVARGELEQVAQEHGSTVPDEFRPEKVKREAIIGGSYHAGGYISPGTYQIAAPQYFHGISHGSAWQHGYHVNPSNAWSFHMTTADDAAVDLDPVAKARKHKGYARTDFLPKRKGGTA